MLCKVSPELNADNVSNGSKVEIMPKGKTKKAVGKRFKKTGSGNFVYTKAGASHLMSSKNRKRKRNLRKKGVLSDTEARRIRHMIAG